jgi:diaminopropionate ammonia-lyase
VPDEVTGPCMRLLAQLGIVAGESAIAGLAAVLCAAAQPPRFRIYRSALGLDGASRVLVFGTEGCTDQESYAALMKAIL